MKKLLIVFIITAIKAMATGQIYHGASVGVSIGKSWDGKAKKIRHGINDIYLNAPIGYTTKNILLEVQPQVNASLSTSLSAMGGYKIDLSDNEGIHFLIGCKDELWFKGKPFGLTQYPYGKATARLWLGNFMIQGQFIKKKEKYGGNEFEVGIGVIGF